MLDLTPAINTTALDQSAQTDSMAIANPLSLAPTTDMQPLNSKGSSMQASTMEQMLGETLDRPDSARSVNETLQSVSDNFGQLSDQFSALGKADEFTDKAAFKDVSEGFADLSDGFEALALNLGTDASQANADAPDVDFDALEKDVDQVEQGLQAIADQVDNPEMNPTGEKSAEISDQSNQSNPSDQLDSSDKKDSTSPDASDDIIEDSLDDAVDGTDDKLDDAIASVRPSQANETPESLQVTVQEVSEGLRSLIAQLESLSNGDTPGFNPKPGFITIGNDVSGEGEDGPSSIDNQPTAKQPTAKQPTQSPTMGTQMIGQQAFINDGAVLIPMES
jgi:hypothetical protein